MPTAKVTKNWNFAYRLVRRNVSMTPKVDISIMCDITSQVASFHDKLTNSINLTSFSRHDCIIEKHLFEENFESFISVSHDSNQFLRDGLKPTQNG